MNVVAIVNNQMKMDKYVKMVKDIRKHFKENPEFEKECKELAEEIINK